MRIIPFKKLSLIIAIVGFGLFISQVQALSLSDVSDPLNNTSSFSPSGSGNLSGPMGLPPEGKPVEINTSYIKQKWLNVPYATASETEKMDIYLPNNGSGPFPVIVSLHGGGFALGDKSGSDLEAALAGLERGYAVVSINYRLSGEALFPAQINDVKAAIRFIRANSVKYNLNADKIVAWGGSAGGALAALAGTSGDVSALQDPNLGNTDQSDRVEAVVDWYGPINFLTMDDQFNQSGIAGQSHNSSDSFESKLMGQQITIIPDEVQKANPESYISPDDPPFFIQHGTSDTMVPMQQSEELAEKLKSVIGKGNVTIELLEGLNHADNAFRTPENLNKTLDFIDSVLK